MGPWGIAILVLLGATLTEGGRNVLRKLTKEAVRTGYVVADKSSNVIGDLKEKTSDLIAEVKAEQSESNGHDKTAKKKSKKAGATEEA
jgi:hypothetical protein